MKAHVRFHDLFHVARLDMSADGDEETLQAFQLVLRDALRREGAGERIERRANLEDVVDVADGKVRDVGAAPRHHDDVAFQLQLSDRLAHGRAADAEFFGELDLHEPLPGRERTALDRIAQSLGNDLAQRLVAVEADRRELHFLSHRFSPRTGTAL